MPSVALYVSLPVASFRAPRAREYLETLDVPPPSTVYGMLLSLVGETSRFVHTGAEIAIGFLDVPERSVVLRTSWRVKDSAVPLGKGENRRPDFQELWTGVKLAVFARTGAKESAKPSLADRVNEALRDPSALRRHGGLSLGESTHLVNELRELRTPDLAEARILIHDVKGSLALPVWADHVTSAQTIWGQFSIANMSAPDPPPESWIAITPP